MGNLKPGCTGAHTQMQQIFASTKRINLIYLMLPAIKVRSQGRREYDYAGLWIYCVEYRPKCGC
ncbi:hypothetical protein MtrunA17_Chr5g0396161 [Medicago truncatula]|uniref:Uncharacterized protein n=1 Tax=Medicago truncatula TaxID=3880 RepID=G7K7X1_MEDTR|nr:hypothetical protein MTR_5g008480 [Medicago truncatula]RHN53466.1 hypothetical protein MtrunA17_Chr5g0396161 [Medicago truncatula]